MPTDQDRADAIENPRAGDVWRLNRNLRKVVSVEDGSVTTSTLAGRRVFWFDPHLWHLFTLYATLVRRGA